MYNIIIEKQAKILDIKCPFTSSELKNAFATLASIHHPDKGGDTKQFIIIKDAYDYLKEFAINIKSNDDRKGNLPKYTTEGILLSSLGKGLGDLINQKPCPDCGGKGWENRMHTNYTYEHTCPECDGKGYKERHYNICIWCMGTGGIGRHSKTIEMIHTCYKCKGTGQIQILNPVLPKNRVFAKVQNKNKNNSKKKRCTCGALLKDDKCWRCSKIYQW